MYAFPKFKQCNWSFVKQFSLVKHVYHLSSVYYTEWTE